MYTTKEEASSPTVAIESILLSCVIDAEEGRHVATADIPSAFMQVDMDEMVHMRLEGTMVDLLLKVAPEYEPDVFMENGKEFCMCCCSRPNMERSERRYSFGARSLENCRKGDLLQIRTTHVLLTEQSTVSNIQ